MKTGDKGKVGPDDQAVMDCAWRNGRVRRSPERLRALSAARIITAAVGVLLLAVPAATTVDVDLPGPLDGPGHPDLKRRDEKRIAKAVDRLRAGDLEDAAKVAGKAGEGPARRLLDLQIRMAGPAEPPVEDLEQLCAGQPGYAAAWATLTVAAERAGDEATALAAARRSGTLWPDSPWATAAEELERRWIDDRADEARSLSAAGRTDEALELVERALELEPSNRDSLLTKADLLIEDGRVEDADAILRAMRDDPGATIRRARIAERNGELSAAMALYTAVPAGMEDRDAALRRVQLAWRRQNLPTYVQEALASEQLTRAGLAVLLVGLLPEANAVGGGQVPLLSDIVELPSQREVLTAVRIGLLDVDRVEHLFHPERVVDPDEVRYALDRLNTLLGRKPPDWCAVDGPESSDCIALTSPVSGAAVADAVLRTAEGEAP
jgi:tetratricopeptide (TPR) repeat protein